MIDVMSLWLAEISLLVRTSELDEPAFEVETKTPFAITIDKSGEHKSGELAEWESVEQLTNRTICDVHRDIEWADSHG